MAEDQWARWARIAEDEKGHRLRRDEEGEVDFFAFGVGFHNGPQCEVCKKRWCHHCTPAAEVEPCDGGAAIRAVDERREANEVERDAMLLAAAANVSWSALDGKSREHWRQVAKAARCHMSNQTDGE